MDIGAILAALPDVGALGILVIVILIGVRVFTQTDKRADAVLDQTIVELRTEIAALRVEVSALRTELETERTARRAAEEETHRLRMKG